jgi:hypothetical protein
MAKLSGGALYQYLQNVQGFLASPITAVLLLGLLLRLGETEENSGPSPTSLKR